MATDVAPELSVVVPVFGTAFAIAELARRTASVLDARRLAWELLFVDDASADGAEAELATLCAADARCAALGLARNVGQHRALLAGFACTRGRLVAALDGDLQDEPETLPSLLDAAADHELVFAGRSGRHQSLARTVSSRLFKTLLSLTGGMPRDAGLFLVTRGELARRIAASNDPDPFVSVALAFESARTTSVPAVRARRPEGRSAYRGLARWQRGVRALRFVWRRRSGRPPAGRASTVSVRYRLGWLAAGDG